MRKTIRIAGRRIALPHSPLLRRGLGAAMIAGGALGFLPVLGFWMIPVGLAILSIDSPRARRMRRRLEVGVVRRYRRFQAGRERDRKQ
ncbi:hypothetical protein [Hartmannibacter diazotrophicus]|uniref:hypothetical protein n=1 Tax=Hartmannibacter diazotrophicus TaxID=1482074 RepID=UPI001FEB563C|nr:hypothetical protein [Hartmannibacter diazotrophicus]